MKKIHLIGNAHLDPVWLWRWQEGFAEIKATFKSALDRMKEFDDFKFTSACAVYYEWIEKNEPDMFEEIKQRVKEGRWNIVGGWFLQPDCNIPCGEAFARHGLISQRYFLEKFGVMAKTGYNVDSFGHNGNLPQILKKSGMDNYVFMRPGEHEKDITQNLFKWQSMDGSSVNTFRIPLVYNITKLELFDEINEMAEKDNLDYMAFYGVGNHGGGATIKLLNEIHALERENFIFSTCDEYFKQVNDLDLPVVDEDLQYHAKGCYSAYSKIKRDNRLCENNALTAEKFSVIAEKLCGATYPSNKLTKAWKNILFNQFHDILGGCSIKEAYTDAGYLHGETMSITEQAINFALQKISWNIDTLGETDIQGTKEDWKIWEHESLGTPVVVFNPLPWEVKAAIQLNAVPKMITDENNTAVPIQTVRGKQTNSNEKYDTLFQTEIPAFGYKTYRMFLRKEAPTDIKNPFSNTALGMENDFVKLRFSENSGALESYYDKVKGCELLCGETSAVLIDETDCDTWAHGVKAFKNQIGKFRGASVKLIENGCVRSVMRVITHYGQSTLCQDYILSANSARVEVRAKVDFHEKHTMLKLRFPVNVHNPKAMCEIPYGFIERAVNGDEQTCGQWFCVTDNGSGGLGIANDSKYSFDVNGNVASLTVLRSAIYADHFGNRDEFCEFMEQGINEFGYSIFPYCSIADTARKAYELNVKPRHIIETFHKGALKTEFCGIKVSEENIIVTALKQSEDKNGIILRCYETENKDTSATIELPFLNIQFGASFSHNEIKTFYIQENGEVKETNLIEIVMTTP